MDLDAAAGKKLLVVEDNAITREGLATILESEGYSVILAANGREALNLLRGGARPTLILMDMMMPTGDGWEFLEMRRQDRALLSIPVLVTTAIGIASYDWARALGACGILRKPIPANSLLEEVRRHCQEACG